MEILYDEIGFDNYLNKLSHPNLKLLEWMTDESRCIRPICGLRKNKRSNDNNLRTTSLTNTQANTTRKNEFNYETRGTVPDTQLSEFFKTFLSYESFAFVGLIICLQQFLYDLTYMPVKALSVSLSILISKFEAIPKKRLLKSGSSTMNPTSRRLIPRSIGGSSSMSPTAGMNAGTNSIGSGVASQCGGGALSTGGLSAGGLSTGVGILGDPSILGAAGRRCFPTVATAPGYHLISQTIQCIKSLSNSFRREIDSTAISNLSSFLVCICSFWLFNSFITFAAAYHFVRSQSLFKLYVLFNLLEVVDKIWRSLERDALFELIVSMRAVLYSEKSCGDPIPTEVAAPPERASSDVTFECPGEKDKIGVERIRRAVGDEMRFVRIFSNLAICVICVSMHMVMHLARGLLLCISMNSEPSAMFLLLFSNNWAEIKSTVFKKQTFASLFTVASGDVIERFQVLTDALFVYLQMNSALKNEVGQRSASKVFMWLVLMLSVEICVDFLKHAFLIKFNKYSSKVFNSYEWILAYDFLVGRSATLLVTKEVDPSRSPPVNLLGMASFPRIPAERLGFQTLALLTFLLSCVPLKEFIINPLLALLTAMLLWIALVLLNNVLTLYMMAFCVKRVSETTKVEASMISLAPL